MQNASISVLHNAIADAILHRHEMLLDKTPKRRFCFVIGLSHVRSFVKQVSWRGAVFGFAAQT